MSVAAALRLARRRLRPTSGMGRRGCGAPTSPALSAGGGGRVQQRAEVAARLRHPLTAGIKTLQVPVGQQLTSSQTVEEPAT